MSTYTGSTREQAIIKAVMGTCRPCCRGAGSGSPFNPFYCDCTVCCNLDATVYVPRSGVPTQYGTPVDVSLTCGRSFTTWNGEVTCQGPGDPEDPENYQTVDAGETTYTGTSGTLSSPSRSFSSTVWVSDPFTAEGSTWRLVYIHAEEVETNSPFEVYCKLYSILQRVVDGHWCNYALAEGIYGGSSVTPINDLLELTSDSSICPEGWTNIGPSSSCGTYAVCNGGIGLVWAADTAGTGAGPMLCPIYVDYENDPPGLGVPVCCRVQISDNCGAI